MAVLSYVSYEGKDELTPEERAQVALEYVDVPLRSSYVIRKMSFGRLFSLSFLTLSVLL